MGLDSVELVMAVEEEFGFLIPDDDAAKLDTVGKLYQYIVNDCKGNDLEIIDDDIWKRLKAVIVTQLGVEPEEITKEASFVYDLGVD